MRRLQYRYDTKLEFSDCVKNHTFTLRFLPYCDSVQKQIEETHWVEPEEYVCLDEDCFGNRTCSGSCSREHTYFRFGSEGVVEVDLSAKKWEPLNPLFRYPSKHTALKGELLAFAQKMELTEGSAYERAWKIMEAVYGSMAYTPCSTNIQTQAYESFAQKKGVCQDYAHIMIALCRYAGIPARYVAGLQLNGEVTHAWVEIYEDGYWIGFDPTHKVLVDERYIKLSVGRDYQDAALDKGVFIGAVEQQQQIHVWVADETPNP